MEQESKQYVIGVDGGGTKTIAALADLNGKIIFSAETGSSNPRNEGIKKAVRNISEAIKEVLVKAKDGEVSSTFIGLPAVEEEYREKKIEIKKELSKHKEISKIFKGKVIIDSDQITAFFSGTDKREGVLLIAGTGCVAHGWRGSKEVKRNGWGWLADEGSAFWVGQKAFQAVFKDLGERGSKTLITKLVFKNWRLKNKEELMKRVYSQGAVKIIASISILVDEAAKRGDKVAKLIMESAGEELSIAANSLIKKLGFQKVKFPVVLVGRMFESDIVLSKTKKEIKKFAPGVEFIKPKEKPVKGAVKLAIDKLNK